MNHLYVLFFHQCDIMLRQSDIMCSQQIRCQKAKVEQHFCRPSPISLQAEAHLIAMLAQMGMDARVKLRRVLRDLADENGIPWQIKGRIAGGTDAAAIQRSREGVRVASISAPVRSIHCPNSVAKISDMEDGLRLARLFVEAIAKGQIS